MHPQIQLPEFGQCPLCFMDLIEVEKQSDEERLSLRQISLDRQARKLAEIEVQPVTRGNKESDATVQIFGRIDYDETRVSTITSWVDEQDRQALYRLYRSHCTTWSGSG